MKLVIAEKPSVANEISKVIGADKKGKGYFLGNGYYVSWCVGHLIQLAEPEEYNSSFKKWDINTLPIIPEVYKTVVSEKTAAQYDVLKELIMSDDVTELICATDAGREGELIFRLVYDKTGSKKPCKRLWISSLEEKAIQDGFKSLKDSREYDNLYAAAQCRQRADWLVGMNITRLYTTKYNKLLRVGRVQTPTINLIVKRQLDINNFVVRKYFTVVADFGNFKAFSQDFDDKITAENLVECCRDKDGIVMKVEKEKKKENPASLYDLTTLQREANRLLSYSAQQTLDVVQQLYEKKLTTYPRTDSRYITADMETSTKTLIQKIMGTDILRKEITDSYDFNLVSMAQIVNDKKVTDHHAIIPTVNVTKAEIDKLPTAEKNILLLIIVRLITAPYAPYTYTATKAILNISDEAFKATGREIIHYGYKQIEKQIRGIIKETEQENTENESDNVILPPMSEGDIFSVKNVEAKEKMTQPPKPYTEDTLLSAMETAGKNISDEALKEAMKGNGLGTPATRAGIIENIINSGYVERKKKQLLPTETAFTFISIVNDKLKEPELTAEWEKQLEEINTGSRSSTEFMTAITEYVTSLVTDKKQEEVKAVFKTDKEALGTCPICRKMVVEFPQSYSCESGKGGCGFTVWKTIAGKNITKTQAKKLLEKRKTDLIKGFKSKAGKEFEAYIVLKEDNTTMFEFEKKNV